ncbi:MULTISPECIES: Y-family DNA polymerase [Pseudoalteromonas]|jgi:DNA polymerase V|uniref:Y-family DNA polymerase n=1 Tax=Pseudoalteromonas distincta TaxID=77608 RepID=A0A4P9J5V8_9GAMM|nr:MULTISPECIES: Y-family DNA polymerase [Pseudoalteromonas]KAA1153270.1 Y-family DNA polymerase [Pseudoalteromonas distincta]MBB1276341.1 Y-family DNA polymerase [Pseudoalteromonas sp. SR43-3]MBB1280173.1 Y-family DNA polymerase [Pseudoalteromonas sp. SR41-1]MBB1296805.1 Y-family DNA polymerase [Pseudoalteromonas sp. SR41-7]MBB1304223.1 Y-family DNA polymerase [Pseudoalteromonas sp. SR43-5]|tara:strand:- start:84463 stop:85722 length:1260 start_codon:yes stop_codon:yes gene_type:complete
MYALVDAVSFYASAEKVFDPAIRSKPVVVLTNNDGCVCAICPIARRLNIPKFGPYFKVKHLLEQNNVVIRSSNYELYADLSDKMMNIIARFCDTQHIYSIDESFLHFDGYTSLIKDWHEYGHTIRRTVWRETKLPVGVGFGPTPTLAKAANHAAKKLSGFNGVAVINSEQTRQAILQRMSCEDVWGIGRRLAKKLKIMNIHTAWDLAQQNPRAMRRAFSVVVERTVSELNGITCLNWDDVRQDKREIYSTRSFGERICEPTALKTALINHVTTVANKLRAQHSLTHQLYIFAASGAHENKYYKKSFVYKFPSPTNDTCVMANAVSEVFNKIYQPGIRFYKCGVGAVELISEQFQQNDLFNKSPDNPKLMQCLDTINNRYGKGMLSLASSKLNDRWHMNRDFLSPQYTTRWRDIPKIYCE